MDPTSTGRSRHPTSRAAAVFLCAVAANPAPAAEPAASLDTGADIATLCGSKPTVAALVDGSGDNVWRRVSRIKFEDQARRCPNVSRVLYAEADADPQKYNAAINGLVAQGANLIVAFTDFGDAALPIYRKAYRAGVTMVPYYTRLSGTPGKDYAANPYLDQARVGALWGDWVGKTIVTGNAIFLGGVPGASSSQGFFEGFRSGIAKYPGIKLLENHYVVTNWNPADAQRAVAGLIARYPKIDVIGSDYGVEALAAIKAYEQAGLQVPAQATIGSSNELNCKFLGTPKARRWRHFVLDGTNRITDFALRRAMAIRQGIALDEPIATVPFVSADSARGLDPHCDPAAPLDVDFTTGLSNDKLYPLFKR